jgi:hypothetical protein
MDVGEGCEARGALRLFLANANAVAWVDQGVQ